MTFHLNDSLSRCQRKSLKPKREYPLYLKSDSLHELFSMRIYEMVVSLYLPLSKTKLLYLKTGA
jgi:hypothetical protein